MIIWTEQPSWDDSKLKTLAAACPAVCWRSACGPVRFRGGWPGTMLW